MSHQFKPGKHRATVVDKQHKTAENRPHSLAVYLWEKTNFLLSVEKSKSNSSSLVKKKVKIGNSINNKFITYSKLLSTDFTLIYFNQN